jgi:hypothetical protein
MSAADMTAAAEVSSTSTAGVATATSAMLNGQGWRGTEQQQNDENLACLPKGVTNGALRHGGDTEASGKPKARMVCHERLLRGTRSILLHWTRSGATELR